MQIELSPAAEKLIEEYRKTLKDKNPTYESSTTFIANVAIVSFLTKAIKDEGNKCNFEVIDENLIIPKSIKKALEVLSKHKKSKCT